METKVTNVDKSGFEAEVTLASGRVIKTTVKSIKALLESYSTKSN